MVGPGVIATVLGMASMVKRANLLPLLVIPVAMLAVMLITYGVLIRARKLMDVLGEKGIDAASRIVGFFIAAMGMGLIFHGVVDALQTYGVITTK
jgi:multiple antibiotic resistance protein